MTPSQRSLALRIGVFTILTLCCVAVVAALSEPPPKVSLTYPARVLLIRHAEKALDEATPDLNERGRDRAKALTKLFEKSDQRTEPFAKPDALFSPKPTAKSRRSHETLEPLAKEFKLTISADHQKENTQKVAEQIFRDPKLAGKTVLIAWNHTCIPQLARDFKVNDAMLNWKDETYDRVWEITYGEGGKATLRDLPQMLLDGDKKK